MGIEIRIIKLVDVELSLSFSPVCTFSLIELAGAIKLVDAELAPLWKCAKGGDNNEAGMMAAERWGLVRRVLKTPSLTSLSSEST